MKKIVSLFIIFLIVGSSFVVISSLPQAFGASSGIIYQAPVYIDNTQSSATPSPFQQMVKIPIFTFSSYIFDNNTSANFEFYCA
ncbi:MAG: hypothetical protein ACP5SP_08125, partial [Caldisericum sp.]|uniref:hypothetical protein n=1 Tax=Caldisericum sp. TaxID=2499687 RepID=UPI003D0BEAA4